MVFLCCYHRFQWFSMVPDHWSNDAMVSMDRLAMKPGTSTYVPCVLGRSVSVLVVGVHFTPRVLQVVVLNINHCHVVQSLNLSCHIATQPGGEVPQSWNGLSCSPPSVPSPLLDRSWSWQKSRLGSTYTLLHMVSYRIYVTLTPKIVFCQKPAIYIYIRML